MHIDHEKHLLVLAAGYGHSELRQENTPRWCSKSDIQELIKAGLIDSVSIPMASDGSLVKYIITARGRTRLSEIGFIPSSPNPDYI